MTNDMTKPASHISDADRKKTLIAQGAARRKDIKESIHIVRDNLHVDRLAKNAVHHVTGAAYSAVENMFGSRNLRSGTLKKLLPLAASVYSIVSKRKMIMPVLRGAAVVGSVSGGLFMFWRHRQKTRAAEAETRSEAQALGYPDYVDPGV